MASKTARDAAIRRATAIVRQDRTGLISRTIAGRPGLQRARDSDHATTFTGSAPSVVGHADGHSTAGVESA